MNIFIAGGTGTFGRKIIEEIRNTTANIDKIYVYSRDYKKQKELRDMYPKFKGLRFIIGDIRDSRRLFVSFPDDIDVVINATNIADDRKADKLGTEIISLKIEGHLNLMEAATDIRYLLISNSTVNTPKTLDHCLTLLQEKTTLMRGFSVIRFPILHSSDICDMIWTAKTNKVIDIPGDEVNRYLVSIEECAKLLVTCIGRLRGGDTFYKPNMRSVSLSTLTRAIVKRYGAFNTVIFSESGNNLISQECLSPLLKATDDLDVEETIKQIELIKEGRTEHEFQIKF